VAYIRIRSFSNQYTSRDLERKFKELDEDKVNGLILDLRGNQGGLVGESVRVAGRFLQPGQTVVSHRGRASAEQVFKATGEAPRRKYPIVVLVDRASASAAEIVAGALQDHDRALVLGESTFGKGLVQAQLPLSEGAALLLTIARYYTPSGRLIQRNYSNVSFIDYYYRHTESMNRDDQKRTDAGRTVYGGGGIAPDEKYTRPKFSGFQRRVAGRLAFYHFANRYFGLEAPSIPENWTPDDATLRRFQALLTERNIAFSDAEFAQDRAWVVQQLRMEMLARAYGRSRAERLAVEEDREVRQAVASLGAANALAQLPAGHATGGTTE
jgi:carboxyl-terminal processing protease